MSGRALPVRRITREEIDAALWWDHLLKRASRGEVMAYAAVTGVDPAALMAEAAQIEASPAEAGDGP